MSTTNYVQKWNGSVIVDSLIFDNGTNVGIGTTTPGNLLHINSGATPTLSQFRLTANGLGSLSGITYAADNSGLGFDVDYSTGFVARNATAAMIYKNGALLLFTGNSGLTPGSTFTYTPRMVIDLASGNVGIGTTAPGGLLQVQTTGADSSFVMVKPSSATVGETDPFDRSMVRLARDMPESTSQFILNIQSNIPARENGDYEKAGIYVRMQTSDARDSDTRDTVGIDSTVVIKADNENGSVFALYASAQIQSGGDGLARGLEVSLVNRGSDVATLTGLAKNGIILFPVVNPCTAAVVIAEGAENATYFHKGFYAAAAAIGTSTNDSFLELHDTNAGVLFIVKPNGNAGIRTTDFGGGVGAFAMKDAVTVPSSNPTGGGVLFVQSGALKYRGSSGTVSTVAPA